MHSLQKGVKGRAPKVFFEFKGAHPPSLALMVKLGLPARPDDDYSIASSALTGISSQVRPSSLRPLFFFWTPPHCLKKKGTPAFRH